MPDWKYQRHINITPISGGWHNLIVDGEAIGSYGWGVYGLKIKGLAEESLILSIPTVSSAYRVFMKVDDDPFRQVLSVGEVHTSAEHSIPWRQEGVIKIPKAETLILLIKVSNYELAWGGFWNSPQMINERQYRVQSIEKWTKSALMIGVILTLGFYHISLFLHRKNDLASFWLGSWVFVFSLRLVAMELWLGELMSQSDFGFQLGWKLELWGISTQGFFAFFLYQSFPNHFRKIVAQTLLVYSVFLFLFIGIFDVFYSYHLVPSIQIASILILFYGNYSVYRAYRDRVPGAVYSLLGFSFLWFAAIHDILVQRDYINPPYFLGESVILFFILQSQVVSHQFKATYDKSRHLVKKLEKLDQLKDQFLANTSHELRTPLNGIIGITESLIDGASGTLSEKTKKNLKMVSSSGRRLMALVNDILDFSKLKHRDLVLNQAAYSLQPIVQLVMTTSVSPAV